MTTEWTEIARGFYLEGLLVDGDDLWFTDVTVGGVKNARTGQVVLPERTMIGGLLMNADGSLIVAGPGGVAWAHPHSGAHGELVTGLDGVNEMRSDGAGGMVFGTIDLPAVLAGRRPGPSTIRHLSADGTLRLLQDGLTFANGLSLSPDGSTLYFNESFVATRAFPVGPGLELGTMRTLLDKYDCDGMALDGAGNVWISGFASGELLCLAPDGAVLQRLALPGTACTNLRFGGADMGDLYVTMVDPASAQALAEGKPLTEQNSRLLRTRAPVKGAPLGRTGFGLG
ncbi:MAG: SMP-30/gluconolactonase/LRE family protein [Sphingomonadales bacterium]|nr:SMP-30/gluconolactonase/LRE family protein [Sphingomonadales bacterium]